MANLFHSTILIMFTLWRLPVFLMGVSAGLLAVREVEDPHHHRPLLHDVFPWSLSASTSLRPASSSSEASWARRTDRNSVLLLSLVLYNVVRHGLSQMKWCNFFFHSLIKCQMSLQAKLLGGLGSLLGVYFLL